MMAILQVPYNIFCSHMIDSDSESSEEQGSWGGSLKGKAANIDRDFAGAAETIIKQYFSGEDSVYNEESFERRFGAPRQVMTRVFEKYQKLIPMC